MPDDLIAGGSMNLMGFGGESSVYVCQDTPAGEYDITLTAVDGVGGRRDFELSPLLFQQLSRRWRNPLGVIVHRRHAYLGMDA